MLKKSTLLFVSIFVLLFIGLSDYGYGCHKGDPHGRSPDPCPDPDPSPGGGGDGKKKTPAIITFRNWGGDKIMSDGFRTYVDGDFDGLVEVFIGTQGNKGNIFLRGDRGLSDTEGSVTQPMHADTRMLFLDFTDAVCRSDSPCGDVPDAGFFQAGFRVDVNDAIKNGVYAIGPTTPATMRVQFVEAPGVPFNENWFLQFGDDRNRTCDGLSMPVLVSEVVPSNTWRVESFGMGCLFKGGSPHAEPIWTIDMLFEFEVMILE